MNPSLVSARGFVKLLESDARNTIPALRQSTAMATKYAKTAQTGNTGVVLIQSVTTDADAIYRPFEANDLGVDGAIELLTQNREPSGTIVLVQIKTGPSYTSCHPTRSRVVGRGDAVGISRKRQRYDETLDHDSFAVTFSQLFTGFGVKPDKVFNWASM